MCLCDTCAHRQVCRFEVSENEPCEHFMKPVTMELDNGSRIECIGGTTPSNGTIRGHRAEFPFIEWDTFALVPDEVLEEVIALFEVKERG